MVRLTIRQPTILSSFFIIIRVRGSYWQNIYGYAVDDYSARASVFLWDAKAFGYIPVSLVYIKAKQTC